MKKYHVHALAKVEYAFEVEAESEQEAKDKLQKAIDDGDESEFECETYDSGTLEVLDAHAY